MKRLGLADETALGGWLVLADTAGLSQLEATSMPSGGTAGGRGGSVAHSALECRR